LFPWTGVLVWSHHDFCTAHLAMLFALRTVVALHSDISNAHCKILKPIRPERGNLNFPIRQVQDHLSGARATGQDIRETGLPWVYRI
jgi:hypothetical protein